MPFHNVVANAEFRRIKGSFLPYIPVSDAIFWRIAGYRKLLSGKLEPLFLPFASCS
jgi:hypothetical protein